MVAGTHPHCAGAHGDVDRGNAGFGPRPVHLYPILNLVCTPRPQEGEGNFLTCVTLSNNSFTAET